MGTALGKKMVEGGIGVGKRVAHGSNAHAEKGVSLQKMRYKTTISVGTIVTTILNRIIQLNIGLLGTPCGRKSD